MKPQTQPPADWPKLPSSNIISCFNWKSVLIGIWRVLLVIWVV